MPRLLIHTRLPFLIPSLNARRCAERLLKWPKLADVVRNQVSPAAMRRDSQLPQQAAELDFAGASEGKTVKAKLLPVESATPDVDPDGTEARIAEIRNRAKPAETPKQSGCAKVCAKCMPESKVHGEDADDGFSVSDCRAVCKQRVDRFKDGACYKRGMTLKEALCGKKTKGGKRSKIPGIFLQDPRFERTAETAQLSQEEQDIMYET